MNRWNAALALASFLDSNGDLCKNRQILELGAGGALPGIVAAKLGAKRVCIITSVAIILLLTNDSFKGGYH